MAPAPSSSKQPGSRQSAERPVLSIRNLSVSYYADRGEVRAVKDVSIDVAAHEVVGLAGESGSGKSTIAQAILRVLRPPAVITGGDIECAGHDVLGMSSAEIGSFRWRTASMVFQSAMNALNPVATLGAQIAEPLRIHRRMSRPAALERAAELLNVVGIEASRLTSYPHQLSGGMRQRAVIAMAIALEPQLLIMDEPTTALDVVVQRDILRQISNLKARLGFSILFITHDLTLMTQFCDRIAVMYAGELVEMAPARELLTKASHPYTRGLIESIPLLTDQRQQLTGIPGTPPDMAHPPSGCRFHVRCPFVMDVCRTQVPVTYVVGAGHTAACHLLDDLEPYSPQAIPDAELSIASAKK